MTNRLLKTTLLLLTACALGLAGTAHGGAPSSPRQKKPKTTGPTYAQRPEAMALAQEIAARHELDPAWVRRVLGRAVYLPQAVKLVTPPPVGVPKNWRAYRERFIEPRRIAAGVAFWQAQRETLERAEREFGVPARLVVGIIGVETLYGQHTGNYRALDALATLALDFPASHPRAAERSRFFRAELGQLLALKKTGVDPLALHGSYAGALGLPQFMPSSWARFAVDFDGDGRIDLFHSAADAIGSVANYFKAFHWQPGMSTHYPVRFDDGLLDLDALLAPDILPTFSVASFMAKGAVLDEPATAHTGPLALVELQNGDDPPSYVAGTENFYAITRYNWSSYYAMAVIELGREVEAALKP